MVAALVVALSRVIEASGYVEPVWRGCSSPVASTDLWTAYLPYSIGPKTRSLNLSDFVEDQNDPSTSQILPSWPYVPWWGRAPPVRSTPPVQRRSADESCAGTERTRRILAGCTC